MLQKGYVSYYYEYAQGIKTGSTDEAGYCVITKASKDGYNYLAIVMDSPRQKINGESYETKCSFIDAASLFDWAFESLKYATVIRQNDIVTEVPVSDGKDADTVQLVAQEDIRTLVPSSFDSSAVIIKPIDLPTELSAPVTKDTVVCQAEIIYGEQVIATVNLVTAQNIEMSTFLKIINSVKSFLSSKIVLAVVVIAVALVVLYILVFIIRLQKDKKRRQAKKKRHQEFDDSINSNDDYLPPPKR
jgi:D-alanyl-D-alanine carboxypeptidase (penicillin-binding protein 5/6)